MPKYDLVTNIRGWLQNEVDQYGRERKEDLGQTAVLAMEDGGEDEDDFDLPRVGAAGRY